METSEPCRCGEIRSCKECRDRVNKVLDKLKERDKNEKDKQQ